MSFSPYERSPARRYGTIVPHFSQFCKGVCYSFNTIFQKIHRNFEIPAISSAKPFPVGQTNPRICTEGEGVLMPVFGPTRAALAAAAARGADILPSLRLVLTAEALTAPPPPRALELNAELDALCAAVRELADCRAGWLYFCPAYAPLPAAVPRALLQGTVLTFLRGVLRSERRAAVRLAAQHGAAVLALQGGDPARMPGDLPALLHRCGAYVTATGSGPWAAAVRLPLSPALPLREPPAPADLVLDRYSAAKVYLDGLCVEDEE